MLVETRLAQPATCEAVLKAATHMYKALGAAAKAQFAPKGEGQEQCVMGGHTSCNRALGAGVAARALL